MSSKRKKKPDMSVYEDRAALCPHFELCGGCTMQKISYDKQLQIKAEEVKQLLDTAMAGRNMDSDPIWPDVQENRHSGFSEVFEGIFPSPLQEGYRNKMEFTFGDESKGGVFSLGLHMRGSFMNVVNIRDCHLVHEDINRIRNAVRDFFAPYYELGILSFRNNKTQKGYLRHLLVRRAHHTGQILVGLVTTSQYGKSCGYPGMQSADNISDGMNIQDENDLLENMKQMLLDLELEGEIAGILHIVNDCTSDMVRSDRTDILYGTDHIYEEVLGIRFKISVFSFFQTNTAGAEVLYTKAREYAGDACGILFDLYSGTGTIAQLMSSYAERVIGVEIVPEAVEAAKENALSNHIANTTFIAADVLKALDELPEPDYIILDPPREGINPKALGKILKYNIPHIVYISCKPSSLARDMQGFLFAGYYPERICCVDMFPQTGHVETVCLMSKVKG